MISDDDERDGPSDIEAAAWSRGTTAVSCMFLLRVGGGLRLGGNFSRTRSSEAGWYEDRW